MKTDSESVVIKYNGHDANQIVLFDKTGVKYTFVIPGIITKPDIGHVFLLTDLEQPIGD
jgi:hypothetical protein